MARPDVAKPARLVWYDSAHSSPGRHQPPAIGRSTNMRRVAVTILFSLIVAANPAPTGAQQDTALLERAAAC